MKPRKSSQSSDFLGPKNSKGFLRKQFTTKEAKEIGDKLGIKWDKWDVEQFRMGLDVELEHGTINPRTNITNDDPIMTGKIALAHLNEFADYYDRLEKLEKEADKFWGNKKTK